jgi:hypothetical protein
MDRATCRSCGASIFWVVMPSGKRMPVDTVPSPRGTVVLDGNGCGHVDTGPGRAKFTSHFATCIHASKHRRSR